MRYSTTIFLLTATQAVAAPFNFTTIHLARSSSFQGSIQFFTRWDCQNDCVENGLCLGENQVHQGVTGSENPFIGWDSGCWPRPDGVHSISLSASNGHGYKGISVGCEEYDKLAAAKNWDAIAAIDSWDLKTKDGYAADGSGHCSVFNGESIKAVIYDWE